MSAAKDTSGVRCEGKEPKQGSPVLSVALNFHFHRYLFSRKRQSNVSALAFCLSETLLFFLPVFSHTFLPLSIYQKTERLKEVFSQQPFVSVGRPASTHLLQVTPPSPPNPPVESVLTSWPPSSR